MIKVEIQTETGLVLRTNTGLWIATAINSVAWQLAIDHEFSKQEAQDVLKVIWKKTGAKKLFALVPLAAENILKIAKQVGFKQEGRMKGACEIGDMIIIGRLR